MSNAQKPIASDYESEKVAGSSPAERAKEVPYSQGKGSEEKGRMKALGPFDRVDSSPLGEERPEALDRLVLHVRGNAGIRI